jgi:hypothetical protein
MIERLVEAINSYRRCKERLAEECTSLIVRGDKVPREVFENLEARSECISTHDEDPVRERCKAIRKYTRKYLKQRKPDKYDTKSILKARAAAIRALDAAYELEVPLRGVRALAKK